MRHSGEEYIYVLEGRVKVHTEFYDPVILEPGESIYIDSNMGHAYVAADGCEEATVLGVCSSNDQGLMESLMSLHGDPSQRTQHKETKATRAAEVARAPTRPQKSRKR